MIVNDAHLMPESREALIERLSDDELAWRKREGVTASPREMWGVFYEGSRKPFIITTTLGKALSRLHYRLTHDDWNRYG